MYKTSFNGLEVVVEGVYSAYNLSEKELQNLKRCFGESKVNGSQGNYTVYKDANRKVLLNLFIHDIWKPISFDIRKDLLQLFNSNKLYKKDIEKISKELKEMRIQLHVDYDPYITGWHIIDTDYDNFLNLLKQIIAEL